MFSMTNEKQRDLGNGGQQVGKRGQLKGKLLSDSNKVCTKRWSFCQEMLIRDYTTDSQWECKEELCGQIWRGL